jgi:hypothetical protein
MDRHMRVFVAAIRLVTLVGCGVIGRVEHGFVIDNHVLTWQGQLDPHAERLATLAVPMRYFK